MLTRRRRRVMPQASPGVPSGSAAAGGAAGCRWCPPGAPATPMAVIVSFGFGHGDPPRADMTVDLREHFRDPQVTPELRELAADNPRVSAAVLATPGITALIGALSAAARAYLA
jgi:hypothetical protein